MAFSHEALPDSVLGPAVLKLAGPEAPEAMRKAVAKGVAPLPPRDLLVALYQYWASNDSLAQVAEKSIERLPPAVIEGALGDRNLPPGVLDLLGRKLLRKEELLDQVVRHPLVHDETLAGVARACPAGVCDTLAENQTRWLTFPRIVENLYNNPNCRMSVVHRMLELAEREGVEVKLAAMEEIRQAMAESEVDESRDARFAASIAAPASDEPAPSLDLDDLSDTGPLDDDLDLPEFDSADDHADKDAPEPEPEAEAEDAPPVVEDLSVTRERRQQQLLQMTPMEKIRAALLGTKFDRQVLVRDSNKVVSMAAIKSPKVRDDEVVGYSANRALSHDVLRYIANKRDWVKLYQVKLNLVMNPKTPLAKSMTFLAHLSAIDVRKVSRSKNIPSALAKAAKRKNRG